MSTQQISPAETDPMVVALGEFVDAVGQLKLSRFERSILTNMADRVDVALGEYVDQMDRAQHRINPALDGGAQSEVRHHHQVLAAVQARFHRFRHTGETRR